MAEVAGGFNDQAVVPSDDVAVGHADIAAVVNINAIAVRDLEIVKNLKT